MGAVVGWVWDRRSVVGDPLEGQAPQWLPLIRGWERKWERVRLAGASLGSLVLASATADLRRRGGEVGRGSGGDNPYKRGVAGSIPAAPTQKYQVRAQLRV
jgi:hypothetical protein